MRRRDFVGVLCSLAAASPLVARAQDIRRSFRLGFMNPVRRSAPAITAFFDELRQNGFIEGKNLVIVPGGFEIRNEHLAEIAASLVAANPDLIVAGPELPLRALLGVTKTIPLVGMTEDMVAAGLVVSLARPGGNITGISLLSPELDGKRQDLLLEAAPEVRKIVIFADSNVTTLRHVEELQAAARHRGVEAAVRGVANREDIFAALGDAKASGAQAINFLATPIFSIDAAAFIARVTELGLPSIYQWPEAAEEGALMGYGPRFPEIWRQRARIVIKVLHGASPSEIPVEQPTRFELVINLRTAKAMGHEIPATLVLRADKVIE
jgi:putative ABC transport system substrate-binding protein